jgi:uracil-DNA glycosylase
VLLLNTTLTVEDGQPASHAKQGWEVLTDAVIKACAQKSSSVVFMLWGGHAQAKAPLIAAHNLDARHTVLCANHPSPLSALRPPAPFMGCGHFGLARAAVARQDSALAQSLFI